MGNQRKWTQQDAFDPTKDRRGGTDPEREAENRQSRYAWIAAENSQTETDVLQHIR
jgi:hypothetical protein